MKKCFRFWDEHLEEVFLGVLLSTICIVMLLQIVMRFVFNNALTWAEELCRTCFIYSGFLCISYCQNKGNAIRIDVIVNLFPVFVRKVIGYLGQVFLFVFYVFFFVNSLDLLKTTAAGGSITSALAIPLQYVYFAMTLGMGLAAFRSVEHFIRFLMKLKKGEKEA